MQSYTIITDTMCINLYETKQKYIVFFYPSIPNTLLFNLLKKIERKEISFYPQSFMAVYCLQLKRFTEI